MEKFRLIISWIALVVVLAGIGFFVLSQKESQRENSLVQFESFPFGLDGENYLPSGRAYGFSGELKKLSAYEQNLLERARDYYKSGQKEPAFTALDELLRQNKSAVAAYLQKIAWLKSEAPSKKHLGQLINCFNNMAKLDPGHPYYRNALGEYLWEIGNLDSSFIQFELASDFSPMYPKPHVNKGKFFLHKEKFLEAQYEFQLAISLSQGKMVEAYENLAWVYYKRGVDDSAGLVLDHCKKVGMESDLLKFVEALLWEVTENLDLAKSKLLDLLKLDSSNANYKWALETLGKKPPRTPLTQMLNPIDRDFEEATVAIEILDPLTKKYPDEPLLWMALGQAYMKRDLNAHAVHAFDFALAIDPEMEGLNELREKAIDRIALLDSLLLKTRQRPEEKAIRESESNQGNEGTISQYLDLGHYLVPWGENVQTLKAIHYNIDLDSLAPGYYAHNYLDSNLRLQNRLHFNDSGLWLITLQVEDISKSPRDLFGHVIGRNSKLSGAGKSTGEAQCEGFGKFQAVIWENEDTVELIFQKLSNNKSINMIRLGKQFFKEDPKLCDYVLLSKIQS